jgi:hypothetical protein
MAADLIRDPRIDHTFVHDLESAFYVILWLCIKFLPNNWNGAVRSLVMNDLFNPPTFKLVGSQAKVNWMARAVAQTDGFYVDGNPILSGLITSLAPYFQARYKKKDNDIPPPDKPRFDIQPKPKKK